LSDVVTTKQSYLDLRRGTGGPSPRLRELRDVSAARSYSRVGAGCVCAVFCRNAGAEQNQIWRVFSWVQKEISAELLAADQALFSFSEYERDERQSAPTC